MVKKFLTPILAAMMTFSYSPPLVLAENLKAEELREIINSNYYYIEYEVSEPPTTCAAALAGVLS